MNVVGIDNEQLEAYAAAIMATPREQLVEMRAQLSKLQGLGGKEQEGLAEIAQEDEPGVTVETVNQIVAGLPVLLAVIDARLKQELRKPAVPKAPKGQDPTDADGLLTMPVNHYVKEHLEAQMQAGKNWLDKGIWEESLRPLDSASFQHFLPPTHLRIAQGS